MPHEEEYDEQNYKINRAAGNCSVNLYFVCVL